MPIKGLMCTFDARFNNDQYQYSLWSRLTAVVVVVVVRDSAAVDAVRVHCPQNRTIQTHATSRE